MPEIQSVYRKLSALRPSAGAIWIAAWLAFSNPSAHAFSLVSPQEVILYQGEAGFMASMPLKSKNPQPTIDVVSPVPDIDGKVMAPFPIEVRFTSTLDAAIQPGSFKVMYGLLKLDITDRLLKVTKVTSEGFRVDKADIPKGKHRLVLQVLDNKNRVAEKDLRLIVE